MWAAPPREKPTNSKISPGFLLKEWKDGEVKEQDPLPEHTEAFTFEATKELVYLQSGPFWKPGTCQGGKLCRISEVLEMRENKMLQWKKVTKIYNHEDFMAPITPNTNNSTKLTPKKKGVSFAWPNGVDPLWVKYTTGGVTKKRWVRTVAF